MTTVQFASCDDQYKKFPQLDRKEVLKLLEWTEKQPHLPTISEIEAIIFLHACNYSVEKAKARIDTYFTMRTHVPEFFGNRNPNGADVTAQMKVLAKIQLGGLTNEGHRVILCKLIDNDASKYDYVHSSKLFFMVTDLWMAQNDIADGYVLVIDMEGSTLSHLTKVSIVASKKFLYYIQEALPVRLRGLHYVNSATWMDKFLAMIRPFLKKELMDMMHLHSSLDTFVDKFVARSMLPNEYGGSAGNIKDIAAKVYEQVQANAPFYVEEEKRRVNEKLRPGKPKTESDLFGTEGNFKQLQFD